MHMAVDISFIDNPYKNYALVNLKQKNIISKAYLIENVEQNRKNIYLAIAFILHSNLILSISFFFSGLIFFLPFINLRIRT